MKDDCIDHGKRSGYDVYAYKWRNGKQYPLHRLVYADEQGIDISELPFEVVIRHICDNRRCINPSHLIRGSRAENTKDMMVRGRFKSAVTQREALEIMASEIPVQKLAEVYNVTRQTIRKIKNKSSWSHIEQKRIASIRDKATGERNGNSVLTTAQVKEIIASELSQRKLAARFNVSQTTIWAIKNGYTWKNK